MLLAGATVVRNECDIIEPFVRYHASLLDRLYILDNLSSDATPIILEKLQAEGVPVVYVKAKDSVHQQGRKTTDLIRHALADNSYDFVFPLDCDEFLQVPDRSALEKLLAQIPESSVGLLENVDYIPTPNDDLNEMDAVRRITNVAKITPYIEPKICKVVIPAVCAKKPDFFVGEGNHHVQIGGEIPTHQRLKLANIAHFPVRSIEQFVSKVVVGRLAWLSRPDYNPVWSRHFGKFWADLKTNSNLTILDLQEAALFYVDRNYHPAPFAQDGQKPYQVTLVRSPLAANYPPLRYTDLMKIAILPRILDAAQSLAEQLQLARSNSKISAA